MKIGVDCGHTLTGADTGAVGLGRKEQDLTREVGTLVMKYLQEQGHTVIKCYKDACSNLDDSLSYRTNTANNNKVDLFISIHFNAYNGEANGTEVFTWDAKPTIKAVRVNENLAKIGYHNRGIKRGNDLYVIRNTVADAMLIEVCFMDNKYDMAKYNAQKIANAIVHGITGVWHKEDKPVTPSQIVKYDESIPTGDNIYRIPNTTGYIEQTADGRLIIHKDKGNYLTIGQGFIDAYWNDNNGNGGNKRISN